jgi:hypothetical protein
MFLSQVFHLQPLMKAMFLMMMMMALYPYLRRDSKKVCTSAPFFEVPVAIRRRGRSNRSCWMMTPWCLIASLQMAVGTELNAYEKALVPLQKLLPLYTPDAVQVSGEPPLDGGL